MSMERGGGGGECAYMQLKYLARYTFSGFFMVTVLE